MFDAKQWRERAEQSRVDAERATAPAARDILLDIAQVYEKLAQRAEESAAGKNALEIGGPPLTA